MKNFKMVKIFVISFCVTILTGCGQSLSGFYTDSMGLSELKFESNGKVYTKTMGIETEMKYEVEGKRVKFVGPQGNIILNIQDDGSLDGLGTKFSKKK